MNHLYTPFSTSLSGSAKETELRLRSIFQWERRRPPVVLLVLLLLLALGCGGLVSCGSSLASADAEPEDPYSEILDLYYEAGRIQQADRERWHTLLDTQDSPYAQLVRSVTAPYWAWEGERDYLSGVGYTFRDLNGDGVEELLLGWIGNEFWNLDEGYVFAIYTLSDGVPSQAVEGWERCRYVLCPDGTVCQEGSGGAFSGSCIRYRFPKEPGEWESDSRSVNLEPVEAIWHLWNEGIQGLCWACSTDPEEIRELPDPSQHGEPLDEEIAQARTEQWMNEGVRLTAVTLAQYGEAQPGMDKAEFDTPEGKQ